MKKEKPFHLLLKLDSQWNMHHTHSGSHLKIRGEKHQNPSQTSAANGSQLGAPGGMGLPRKVWHSKKSKLPGWPERALLLCTVHRAGWAENPGAHISWEKQQKVPLTHLPLLCGCQAHHHTTQRVHCTHISSVLCKFWLQPCRLSTSSCSCWELADWPLIPLTSLLR